MILLVKSSTKRRRRIAFQFTIRLVPLVLIVIIQMLARWVQSIEIQRPEVAAQSIVKSKFPFDSIIWDEKSLYNQATKVANNNRNNHISTSIRAKRSATTKDSAQNQQQLVDACQSKMEILTPYYATNSKGNLRTIVNSELMQQAIQVETCVRSPNTGQSNGKCSAQLDCGCEQKYKWHRLLVLDPKDSGASQGLFMDWFLFPSSCVCRCKSSHWTGRHFLRTIKKLTYETQT